MNSNFHKNRIIDGAPSHHCQLKKGFTLVELLVVIAIIGILATLITAASVSAWGYVKVGRIKIEMSQIEMALEQYKNEFGEYPPDFFDDPALVRHVKKRWPRYAGSTVAEDIRSAIHTAYLTVGVTGLFYHDSSDSTNARACQFGSLVLWLGGFPDTNGRFRGFGADPANPFNVVSGQYDDKTFIELTYDASRPERGNVRPVLYDNANPTRCVFILVQNAGSDRYVPYVYFRGNSPNGSNYATGIIDFTTFQEPEWGTATGLGIAVPYARSAGPNVWHNPTTYQLIHPGLDGRFGAINGPRVLDGGTGLDPQDMDNIVNFGDGTTIKSLLP